MICTPLWDKKEHEEGQNELRMYTPDTPRVDFLAPAGIKQKLSEIPARRCIVRAAPGDVTHLRTK